MAAIPNGVEVFEACLAVWKLGATPNPVSSVLPELERRAIVETANPVLLVGVQDGEYPDRNTLAPGFEPSEIDDYGAHQTLFCYLHFDENIPAETSDSRRPETSSP